MIPKIWDVDCVFCHANPGQPCVSRNGAPLNYYHNRRRQNYDIVAREHQEALAKQPRRSSPPSWIRRFILRVTRFV